MNLYDFVYLIYFLYIRIFACLKGFLLYAIDWVLAFAPPVLPLFGLWRRPPASQHDLMLGSVASGGFPEHPPWQRVPRGLLSFFTCCCFAFLLLCFVFAFLFPVFFFSFCFTFAFLLLNFWVSRGLL